jgi:large subunit ribosomal protein L25
MTEILELAAEIRSAAGKSPAKAYRNKGQTPAIVYGHNKEPMLVAVDSKLLNIAYHKVDFKSKVIKLNIGSKSHKVMVREVQVHPVTDLIEHADFAFIEDKQPVKVSVNLKFTNLDKSAGMKKGGKINTILRKVEVECLPKDAPRLIEVDLSQLNIGQKIKEQDLVLPKGIKIYDNKNRIILTMNGKNKDKDAEGEQANK